MAGTTLRSIEMLQILSNWCYLSKYLPTRLKIFVPKGKVVFENGKPLLSKNFLWWKKKTYHTISSLKKKGTGHNNNENRM